MRKDLIILVFLLFILGISGFNKNKAGEDRILLRINNQKVFIEIANTASQRARGLSGRERLPENNGLLFIFPEKQYQIFWMKDMKFPIDIVWINGDQVIGFVENAAAPATMVADDRLERYSSPEAVDKVLEVNAGMVKKWGIKGGEVISF